MNVVGSTMEDQRAYLWENILCHSASQGSWKRVGRVEIDGKNHCPRPPMDGGYFVANYSRTRTRRRFKQISKSRDGFRTIEIERDTTRAHIPHQALSHSYSGTFLSNHQSSGDMVL